jgi:hypothetical protein
LSYIITDLIDLLHGQAFVAGIAESAVKFFAAEILFSAVAFNDFEFFGDNGFKGGKSGSAFGAFTASPDTGSVKNRP